MAAVVLASCGGVTAFGLLAAPVETLLKLKRASTHQQFPSSLPLFTGFLYFSFAFLVSSWMVNNYARWVVGVNGVGMVAFLVYLLWYYFQRDHPFRNKLGLIGGAIVCGLLVGGGYISTVIAHGEKRKLHAEIFGCVADILLAVGPFEATWKAIKEKDASEFSLWITLLTFFNSIFWIGYGLAEINWFIAGPNLAMLVVSGVQLSIYAWLKCLPPAPLAAPPTAPAGAAHPQAGDVEMAELARLSSARQSSTRSLLP